MQCGKWPLAAPVAAIVATAVFISLSTSTAAGQTETVIHSFQPTTSEGASPSGGVVFDKAGAIYGTTSSYGAYGGGMVYKLTPPTTKTGTWTETILHSFPDPSIVNDGRSPGGPIFDKSGALLGTTGDGGYSGAGTVFTLQPPAIAGGKWSYEILYNFKGPLSGGGSDGSFPNAEVIFDAKGNLYGTTRLGGTYGQGTVFKLAPPATQGGTWTESILYNFSGGSDGGTPESPLTMRNGSLYGAANAGGSGLGVIFQLKPVGAAWTESVLYSFPPDGVDGGNPQGGLVFDKKGSLYGTAQGGNPGYGAAFKLSPSGSTWTESVIYNFTGTTSQYPSPGLVFDSAGNLYGTAQGYETIYGFVFELSPPGTSGSDWTETTQYSFTGGTDGAYPEGLLVLRAGNLYGTTYEGGSANGGVVFEIKP
jgi:uncharacterized repeat protein (TIGR03803 family)